MGYNPRDKNFYFANFMEFGLWARVNGRHLADPNDEPALADELLIVRVQLDQMVKAAQNTSGGCGCNIQKRRDFAVSKYKETLKLLAESDVAVARLKARNQNSEKFIFRLTGSGEEIFMEL